MTYDEAKMRQAQEAMFKIISGGFHKDLAKICKKMYDAFRKEGFSRGQALDLTKAIFMSGKKAEE